MSHLNKDVAANNRGSNELSSYSLHWLTVHWLIIIKANNMTYNKVVHHHPRPERKHSAVYVSIFLIIIKKRIWSASRGV